MENLNKIDTALKKCDLFLLVSMLGGRERERGREKGREGGEREREREERERRDTILHFRAIVKCTCT